MSSYCNTMEYLCFDILFPSEEGGGREAVRVSSWHHTAYCKHLPLEGLWIPTRLSHGWWLLGVFFHHHLHKTMNKAPRAGWRAGEPWMISLGNGDDTMIMCVDNNISEQIDSATALWLPKRRAGLNATDAGYASEGKKQKAHHGGLSREKSALLHMIKAKSCVHHSLHALSDPTAPPGLPANDAPPVMLMITAIRKGAGHLYWRGLPWQPTEDTQHITGLVEQWFQWHALIMRLFRHASVISLQVKEAVSHPRPYF